ncbi:MAG: flippase-like domain-containing protein [Bdellovibrionales bacterium]|nr:flippase-like domain-containing protein [Bdellovibrionales bacterium]
MSKKLRFVFAAVLLALLIYIVHPADLLAALAEVELVYIYYLLLLAVALVWLSCLKWRLFIRASGHDAGILRLMKLYTIGYFFNIFTPSYVGGDVARSYQLGKFLGNQKDAFVATFLERFTGLLAMVMLGVGSVALGSEVAAGVETAILLVGAVVFTAALMCFSEKFGNFCVGIGLRIMRAAGFGKLAAKLETIWRKIVAAMAHARRDWMLMIKAFVLSFAFHAAGVFNTWVACRAVGWESPDFGALFVVVPLVLLVGMVPITPSGLGLQEGAFLFFLKRIGATDGQALGVGVLLRAKVMAVALFGGLLFATLSEKSRSADEDTDSLRVDKNGSGGSDQLERAQA